jgi:hypothetical protein
LGERQTEDLKVPGSIPGGGNIYIYIYILVFFLTHIYILHIYFLVKQNKTKGKKKYRLMSLWRNWITLPPPKGTIAGSNPVRDKYICIYACLAQSVERTTLNRVVAGSSPAVGKISTLKKCVDSSMVRIRAFQARGPGSIPGRRKYILTKQKGLWCNG